MYEKNVHCVSVYLVGCVLQGLNRIGIVSLLQQSDDTGRGLQISQEKVSFRTFIYPSSTTFPCP